MHCLRLARAFTGRTNCSSSRATFTAITIRSCTPSAHLPTTSGRKNLRPSIPDRRAFRRGWRTTSSLCRTTAPTCSRKRFAVTPHELAAVICEPIYYNAGCIIPDREFMDTVSRRTDEAGVLLIFDEVLSAFRMGPAGAGIPRHHAGPLYAGQGGRRRLSAERLRRPPRRDGPLHAVGDCQHSGTYNGHVVSVAAGLAAVAAYREPGFYDHIRAIGRPVRWPHRDLRSSRYRRPRAGIGGAVRHLLRRRGTVRGYRDAVRHQREPMLRFIASAIVTASISMITAGRRAITVSAGHDAGRRGRGLNRLDGC